LTKCLRDNTIRGRRCEEDGRDEVTKEDKTKQRNATPARKGNDKGTQIRIESEELTIKKKRGKKVRIERKLRKGYRYELKVHFHEIVHHGT
jgi:transcription antitermination factor NusG